MQFEFKLLAVFEILFSKFLKRKRRNAQKYIMNDSYLIEATMEEVISCKPLGRNSCRLKVCRKTSLYNTHRISCSDVKVHDMARMRTMCKSSHCKITRSHQQGLRACPGVSLYFRRRPKQDRSLQAGMHAQIISLP